MMATSDKVQALDTIRFTRMTEDQCQTIHRASLELLERVGVRLFLTEAVELLECAGASVSDGNLVRIPTRLVEKAFATVPHQVVLYDRYGEPAIELQGNASYYGPGSDCLRILDHRTGQVREPILSDVIEGTILCDALPNVDFCMSMVLPTDVDQTIADRYQMEALLTHTTKPIVYVTYEHSGCVDAVEMAEVVAGGAEALRRRPNIICYINVTTGLYQNQEALEKLLYLSRKGLPLLWIPSSTAGLSAPITPAGGVVLDNAGMLAGLVLSQLTREGAPFVMSGMEAASIDLRTMASDYTYPERGIAHELGRFYNLPTFGLGGASNAKLADGQAAAEAALTLLAETLAGANLIHDLGYLDAGLLYSFVQLVLCDEIVDWITYWQRGIDVSPQALAVDLIAHLGPGGQYLDTDHTLGHYRQRWYPQLFERNTFSGWQDRGSKSMSQRAAERVDRILEEHQPERLPAGARKQMRAIIERTKASR
jgi:trimethylamine--corrinoid protein Co-methyltransferase